MDLNTPHELNDAQKMELAVITRMHEIFTAVNGDLKWLDAPKHKKLAAKTAAENELDTPEKRLAFLGRNKERRA